jgi:hypothetical protein
VIIPQNWNRATGLLLEFYSHEQEETLTGLKSTVPRLHVHVVCRELDVSEESIASIFRVEE